MKPIFFVLLVGIIAGMPQLSLAQTQAPAPPTAAPAPPAPSAANPGPPAAPTPAPDGAPANPAPASANQAPAAATQPAGPIYVVTYFEVAPASARKTANLLRSFVVAARKEDGNSEFTALHEVGRPGRFALVEAWRDKAALDAHGTAMKALGEKLQPLFLAPFDARQFLQLSIAASTLGAGAAGTVWVLTHVDVFPSGKDQVTGMVKQLAEDSRKDAGALRFDAVVWDGHANHFHLIEAWADRKSLEVHAAAEHTKAFRAKLVPFEGALYDERLYEVVR